MENRFWKIIGHWAMALILLVATFIIIRWAVNFATWASFTSANSAAWVGALGTVGTLLGTIHLARAETRKRERDELAIARLHGASMVMRIANAYLMVREVVVMLELAIGHERDLAYFLEIKGRLEAMPLWTVAELVPLVPLPSNTAVKLAEAAEHIPQAAAAISQFFGHPLLPLPIRNQQVVQLVGLLGGTATFLDEACAECRRGAVQLHLNLP